MNIRILSLILPLLTAGALAAQTVPSTLNYQGRLTDNGPTPAPVTATVNMQFAIYDAGSGGTLLWQEPSGVGTTPVSVTGGIFSVLLGTTVPVPATAFTGGTTRWLQITANGEILTPRQKLAANGWANQAEKAGDSAKLGGTAAAGYQLATVLACGGGQFINAISNGSAGCGTPVATLVPPVSLSASTSSAILATTNSGAGNGLTGLSGAGSGVTTGYGHAGVVGDSDIGYGVVGGSSTGTAGQFQINNPAGPGSAIYATTSGTGSAGLFNISNGSSTAFALNVQNNGGGQTIYSVNSGNGRAGEFRATSAGNSSDVISVYGLGNGDVINGYAQGANGRAGYFTVGDAGNASPSVYAAATAGPGISASSNGSDGVVGTSYNASSAGLHGVNNTSSAFQTPSGVLGESTVGYGVQGNSTNATGVYGRADSGIGVYGYTNTTAVLGSGGYFYNINGYGMQAETYFGTVGSGGTAVVRAVADNATNLFIGCSGNRSACTNKFRVDTGGTVFANGGFLGSGADVAEFVASDDALEAGDVIEIDPDHDGKFRRVREARSGAVAGVITTKPGLTMNAGDAAGADAAGPALALAGRVPVKVTGENGPIRRGDLLVSSTTPGRAMKAPARPEPGTIIGKALGEMTSASGVIEMLVMLR